MQPAPQHSNLTFPQGQATEAYPRESQLLLSCHRRAGGLTPDSLLEAEESQACSSWCS